MPKIYRCASSNRNCLCSQVIVMRLTRCAARSSLIWAMAKNAGSISMPTERRPGLCLDRLAVGIKRPPRLELFHVLQRDQPRAHLFRPPHDDPRQIPYVLRTWFPALGFREMRAVRRGVQEIDDQAAGHGSSLKHPLLANAPSRKLATGMPAARYFFRLFVSGSTTSLQCLQTVALLMPDIRARSENDLPDSLR